MTIMNIAIIIGITYWIIGISGSWKRAFWLVLFSLVAFVIAFQYSDVLLELMTNNSSLYSQSIYTNSALSFLLVFGVTLTILIILYHILWDDKEKKRVNEQPGLMKFAQSILTGLVGYGIGVVFAIAILAYTSSHPGNVYLQREGTTQFLHLSANFMIQFGRSFSVNELPVFLTAWVVI